MYFCGHIIDDMKFDLTTTVAIYGALLSTIAVGWNVYRDFHDRAKLKLSTMLGHPTESRGQVTLVSHEFAIQTWPDRFVGARPKVFVTITNVGKRPVIAQGWAIRVDRKKTGNDNFIYPLSVLPKVLKEGEYAVESTDDLPIMTDCATGIFAWDSTGKKWRLPRRVFRKLQREIYDATVHA
jgi:hypothetical protein